MNYNDKEQLCERLYKHAETKSKYFESLKALKDHVELRDCTFKPELVTAASSLTREGSKTMRAEPYQRLHHQHEENQRKRLKKENAVNQ